MGKPKGLKDRLFGAAVLKMSFRLRGDEQSPAFKGIYPGVLRDLALLSHERNQLVQVGRANAHRHAARRRRIIRLIGYIG